MLLILWTLLLVHLCFLSQSETRGSFPNPHATHLDVHRTHLKDAESRSQGLVPDRINLKTVTWHTGTSP